MKGAKTVVVGVGVLFLWAFPLVDLAAQQESTCVKCHTSPKTLIELTRALAVKRPPKKSAETKGEG